MKYRIIKRMSFDGTIYAIERQSPNDALWLHVSDSCSATQAEVDSKFAFILEHGEPKDEVLREVTV